MNPFSQRLVIPVAPAALLAFAANFAASDLIGADSSEKSTPAPAALYATNDLSALSLQELLDVQFTTVFSASRREQKSWEAPAAVSIISRDEIQAYGYRSLADVLRAAPGIYTSNDRNYTYLGISGFSRPGDYNSRVLVLVDGHRVNDNVYDSALIAQEALVEVDSIERVEVIRGPSSSLYGSSAFFGVVNVITRRGGQLNGMEFSGEAGGFETYKGRFTVGHKLKSGVEFLLSGSYYDSAGQRHLYYPEFDSPSTHNGIADNLDYERAWHFLGNVRYQEFTLAAGFNWRTKGIPTAGFGGAFNDPRVQTQDGAGYLDLKHEHEFTTGLKLTTRTDYHRYEYRGIYPYNAADTNAPPDIVLNKDFARGDWWRLETIATKTLFDRLTLTAGGEVRYNFIQDQKNSDQGSSTTVYVDDHSHSAIFGLFGQADFAVQTNLILSAGLRYDHYTSVGNAVNPRFGLMYQPWSATAIKLLYGRAFRAPNAYELHYIAPGYSSNPQLRPETIHTWQIVWEQTVAQKVKLSVTPFYYQVDGLVTVVNEGDTYRFRNTDQARAFGTDVAADAIWGKGWLGRVSYTVQRAEDSGTSDELSNSPRHLVKASLRIPLYRDRLYAGAELHYVGSVKAVQSGRVDPYWLVNLTLLSREIIPGIEFSASIYNVFDHHYAITGFDEHLQRVLPQDGRSFRLKLTYKF